MNSLLRHLRGTALLADGDGVLLKRFRDGRDQAAFAALVRRHGPMVWGVCRRVLGNVHDAEDAFQATFLVLVHKAARVRPAELVGHWLYGVAYRTSLKARTMSARRRAHERLAAAAATTPAAGGDWDEWLPHLDRELSRLPVKYRVPVVLCELEGKSRREAARLLHILEGTLSSRLAAARKMLARRLARRGVILPTGGVAALLASSGASAGAPPALIATTLRLAALVASGTTVAAAVPAPVAALTEGVLQAMFVTKLRTVAVLVLAAGAMLTTAGVPVYRHWADARASIVPQGLPHRSAPLNPSQPSPRELLAKLPAQVAEAAEADKERIQGSGKLTSRDVDVADFVAVDAGQAFRLEIVRGDNYRVRLTADDNLIDYVKAEKQGDALHVRLDTENKSFQNGTWKVSITMPRLERLTLGGASRATVKGFAGQKSFKGTVGGASQLNGELSANSITLDASGACRVTLKGRAKQALLKVSGASHVQLKDFTTDSAKVQASGASTVTINARDELNYHLSGASHLQYAGSPTIGESKTSGASHAGRLKK